MPSRGSLDRSPPAPWRRLSGAPPARLLRCYLISPRSSRRPRILTCRSTRPQNSSWPSVAAHLDRPSDTCASRMRQTDPRQTVARSASGDGFAGSPRPTPHPGQINFSLRPDRHRIRFPPSRTQTQDLFRPGLPTTDASAGPAPIRAIVETIVFRCTRRHWLSRGPRTIVSSRCGGQASPPTTRCRIGTSAALKV